MHSVPVYFENTYRFSHETTIHSADNDEKGFFITLQSTPFYPQGGGQPSDQGELQTTESIIPVVSVRIVNTEIRHYIDHLNPELIGQKVTAVINPEKRILHAKLHTAGHLISNVVENDLDCIAVKGHHFPGECYVEFQTKKQFENIAVDLINYKISQIILDNRVVHSKIIPFAQLSEVCPNLPYKIPATQQVRIVNIDQFAWQPCGGTHVKTTGELKGLTITKSKIKNNIFKIYYQI